MAPASNEEQFKFLISCIRYSNNGKVDFEAVRLECDICSKGAAAKRYERMMKAHGIYQTNSTIADTSVSSTKRKTSPGASNATASTATGSSKKRKATQFTETNTNTDDDEGLSKVKAEPTSKKLKAEAIKEEPIGKEHTPEFAASTKGETSANYSMGFDGADDGAMFNDFLSFGAFGGQDDDSKDAFGASAGLEIAHVKSDGQGLPESIVITD